LTRFVSNGTVGEAKYPFINGNLKTFGVQLERLAEFGPEKLEKEGQKGRLWLKRYWNFASQWESLWMPIIMEAMPPPAPLGKVVHRKSAKPELSVQSHNGHVGRQRDGGSEQLTSLAFPQLRKELDKVSVIIVSHNESGYLDRTVKTFLDTLPVDSEVIVVDDHSTDGSIEVLPTGDKRLRIIRPPERLGVSRSRNYGAVNASGDMLVFSDAHVETPLGWIEPMKSMLQNSSVGAVAPCISAMNSSNSAKGCGGCVHSPTKLDWKWLGWKGADAHSVPMLCGCFLAVRRDVFDLVGRFDAGMVLYGLEDIEFSFRLWLFGYECVVVPSVEVSHMFRNRKKPLPQYQSIWEPRIHNALRMGVIHYGPDRLKGLIKNQIRNPAFSAAWARLAVSDAWERRAELRRKRVYDDEWFFRTFKTDDVQTRPPSA
jgi:GT2 family glycosyltransferase